MHPAPSVILFTVLSGAGFGLLAFLSVGLPPVTGWVAFVFYFIGYALAVGGLLSSTFHLGKPQRALRAFTQWKTSWLSREAWLAVAALCVTGIYAIGVIFFARPLPIVGAIAAMLSLATVYATSMIYGQLKTIPRWNSGWTSAHFLSLSLASGALLSGHVLPAAALIALAGAVQAVTWATGDRRFAERGHTMETATGLTAGKVRLFEGPHSGTNYLLREMVFEVGRKHVRKLRWIAIWGMVVIPALVLAFLPVGHLLGVLTVLIFFGGMFASRWLFFAEAEHVVGLYYGRR